MKEYRVGIVGYGWAATAHIEAINNVSGTQVTAVCSTRELNANELSAQHGTSIQTYTDLDSMLASPDIDAISITSHPWLHREQAIKAAQAGKHIILEKPMALSLQECEEVAEAVDKAGVGFCICFECRYSSQFIATRSIVEQGLLGDLHYGEIDYYHGIGPWYGQFSWNTKKDGGGSSLLSAGCHAIDALMLFLGSDVESVHCLSTKSKSEIFAPYEYDTTSVTLLKFKSGKVGKCASSIDCLQPYYFHTHLIGSKGSILDNKAHFHGIEGMNKANWSELSFGLVDSGDVADHPYQAQFQVFFDSLRSGQAMPLTGLTEALTTHKVIFKAEESARTGQAVELDG